MKTAFTLYLLPFVAAIFSLAPAAHQQTSAAPLEEYAGTYKMKSYFQEAVISVKDGALYGEVDANGNYKLIPQETPDTFKSTSSYGSVYEFKRDAQTKKVIILTLKVMGEEVSGDKVQ